MGGHAAGEVASGIAVQTIAEKAPDHTDGILLGAAVEAANAAVLEGVKTGQGKAGMGCTATCALIENNRMAIAHVGDSRIYLLHAGTLVRITRDHSYVEELVDAGEITADEARVHPSRSIITRALGSDPDMYADHFTLDVSTGDRIILCSDGLSSMVPDKDIEELAVSSVTHRLRPIRSCPPHSPQAATTT
jgi:protein phosphatase